MNFEVFCFDFADDRLTAVHKEYFDTYGEARDFELGEGRKYEGGVSITPVNEAAEGKMACVQCGGQYGYERCQNCKYNK